MLNEANEVAPGVLPLPVPENDPETPDAAPNENAPPVDEPNLKAPPDAVPNDAALA